MLIAVLLHLLQAAAPAPASTLWEFTVLSFGEPVVHQACSELAFDDAAFLAGMQSLVADMEEGGAVCAAPKTSRTDDGWALERVCRADGERVELLLSRTGRSGVDATYTNQLVRGGEVVGGVLSTRYRRIGPCPEGMDSIPTN